MVAHEVQEFLGAGLAGAEGREAERDLAGCLAGLDHDAFALDAQRLGVRTDRTGRAISAWSDRGRSVGSDDAAMAFVDRIPAPARRAPIDRREVSRMVG